MLPNHLIILGGGFSVREGIEKGLFNFLQDKFTIGINFSYKFLPTTLTLGVDDETYNGLLRTPEIKHPVFNANLKRELTDQPLLVWRDNKDIKQPTSNTILFKESNTYTRDLTGGIYKASLSGLFALSLAIKLIDRGIESPIIYLCGYDYGPIIKDGKMAVDSKGRAITHFYQNDFAHRGIGKINWYCQTAIDYNGDQKRKAYAEIEFAPYKDEKTVNIINVGGSSMIPHFPQISYDEFFTHKLTPVRNQDELRQELKEELWKIKKEKNI